MYTEDEEIGVSCQSSEYYKGKKSTASQYVVSGSMIYYDAHTIHSYIFISLGDSVFHPFLSSTAVAISRLVVRSI